MSMTKETTVNANVWERLTDGLSAFGEGVGRWMTRLSRAKCRTPSPNASSGR